MDTRCITACHPPTYAVQGFPSQQCAAAIRASDAQAHPPIVPRAKHLPTSSSLRIPQPPMKLLIISQDPTSISSCSCQKAPISRPPRLFAYLVPLRGQNKRSPIKPLLPAQATGAFEPGHNRWETRRHDRSRRVSSRAGCGQGCGASAGRDDRSSSGVRRLEEAGG